MLQLKREQMLPEMSVVHKLGAQRSQELGSKNVQTGRGRAQVALCWLLRGLSSSVSWTHSLLPPHYASSFRTPPHSALGLISPYPNSVSYSMDSAIFLRACEPREHGACVCPVYRFIPSACPLVGSKVIWE